MRLSEREFWRLSPEQFFALLERRDVEHERADRHFGVLAAIGANPHRQPGTAPLAPHDFFGRKPKPIKQTPAEMKAIIAAAAAAGRKKGAP